MSYIEKQKLEGKTILLDTYGHWISFVQPIAFIPIMVASWIALPHLLGAGEATDFGYIESYGLLSWTSMKMLGVIMVLSGILYLFAWIRYRASEYAVASFRTADKQGIIFRHTGEMPLDKIESVHADQSIMGRLLGYGTVTVVGTGETKQHLKLVPDPMAFRAEAMKRMARASRR